MFSSVDYAASIKGILKLVQNGLIAFIFIQELKDKLHAKRIIASFILGASFASVDAIWQIITGVDFIRGHTPIVNIGGLLRATAAFPNANVLAIYLVPSIVICFGLVFYYLKGKMKLITFLLGVLIISGVLLTFSRFAGLAAFLSLVLLGLIKKNKLLVGCMVLLFVIYPFLAPKYILDWCKSINYNPVIFMFNADRISMYKNTLNMIAHHPLIGVGVNTFSENYSKYKLPEVGESVTGSSVYAHNNFLHMAGEIGIIGLLVFVWLLVKLFKNVWGNYKNTKDKFISILALLLTISLTSFLINGLSETSLYYSRVAILFWFLVGFALSLNSLKKKEEKLACDC
jgi:O-antigen ligase